MMLRQIQHFQMIVQVNSFTEAAELCHISQSGISQILAGAEQTWADQTHQMLRKVLYPVSLLEHSWMIKSQDDVLEHQIFMV